MKSAPECIPCSVKQVMRTAQVAGLDEKTQKLAMRRAMRLLAELDHDAPPAVLATRAIRASDELYQNGDPFERIKWDTTVEALALYQTVKSEVDEALSRMTPVERVRHCAKLAAAGNIIDFGVSSEFDLEGTLKDTLGRDLAVDDSGALDRALDEGRTFLLISDNAGEIVFDRFLLDEALRRGKEVWVGVKSGGILNDATTEDALRAGIGQPIRIIETGSSSLGTLFDECSLEFRDLYERAGVVVSKGQANYETLDDADREIFFILRIKCYVLAGPLGIPNGSSILMYHQPNHS